MKRFRMGMATLVVALLITAPRAEAQGELTAGLDSTLSLVQRLHAKWDSLVAPVARKQAVLSLQRLSVSLDDLALAKLEFAEKVSRVDWNSGGRDLTNDAEELVGTVQTVRRRLKSFLQFVPNDYQATAGRIESQLMTGLSLKIGNLTSIQQLLRTSSPSIAAVRSEADSAAMHARVAKAGVDSLIVSIQRGTRE
jgi:hypothetical protein